MRRIQALKSVLEGSLFTTCMGQTSYMEAPREQYEPSAIKASSAEQLKPCLSRSHRERHDVCAFEAIYSVGSRSGYITIDGGSFSETPIAWCTAITTQLNDSFRLLDHELELNLEKNLHHRTISVWHVHDRD